MDEGALVGYGDLELETPQPVETFKSSKIQNQHLQEEMIQNNDLPKSST